MLSQAEADALFEMQKYQADSAEYRFPPIGGKCAVPLVSADRRERFVLDIRKKSMEIAKGTFQSRQQSVILARLDFGGRPHRNPDDEEIRLSAFASLPRGIWRPMGVSSSGGVFGRLRRLGAV